jgi:hypothetical protein
MKLSDKYSSVKIKDIYDLKIGDIVTDNYYYEKLNHPNLEIYEIESIHNNKVFIRGVGMNNYFTGTYPYDLFCLLIPKIIKPPGHPLTDQFKRD